MAVYTIGDLHLSLGGDHSMEVFPGWEGYVERIRENWLDTVGLEDTVVLVGDSSWGMSLEQALPDFQFIDALPGHKLLLKGNHDYWWSTRAKMMGFFEQHGLNSLDVLNNNCIVADGIAICGSRGWLFETGAAFDEKIINRECIRLELSIREAVESGYPPVAFLHYPPVYGESRSPQILGVLSRYGIRRCYYGHIHAAGCRWAVEGSCEGMHLQLVSSDYLAFRPLAVESP